jgi:Alpha-L-arabinofuranosidase B, catalytic
VRAATVLAVLLLAASPAVARMHAGPNVLHAGHRLQGTIAPLDGGGSFAAPAGAYSLRRLKSTYTGPGIKLRRTTGGTQDINFLGFTGFTGAPLDVAAAASFCAATTCFIDTWYDQSGNARHISQATTTDQPQFIFNCQGSLPCARSPLGASDYLILAGITAVSPLSLNAVAKQTARSTTACREIWVGTSNELSQQATLDLVFLSNGAATVQAVSAGLAWHSHTGVMNGAASVVNVDGVETTGTVTPNLAAGNIVVDYNGGVGATCDVSEAMYWSGYALTQPERAALTQNQRNFWGF